ncbi:MAG: hypothetical protein EHM72_10355, partial [Calditrichaeota bacterium]
MSCRIEDPMISIKFSQRIGLCLLILIAVPANVSWAGAPVHTRLLYENSLQGESDDAFAVAENHGGTFTAGGWRTERDSKLTVQLKDRLPAVGSIEFSVTNFNPLIQTTNGKQTFFALSSRPHTKISLFYEDTLSAFIFLRTGIDYIVGDKCNLELDPAFHGVRSRTDYRDILVNSKWKSDKIYQFKFVWDQYFVWIYLDGQEVKKLDFKGPVERFQHISIGGDDIYHSIIGPVYSNLKIYTAETSAQFDDKSFSKNVKGLDVQKGGHGITVADLNNDGLDDMVISNYADDVNHHDLVYIQQPDHSFVDEADARGLDADMNSFSSVSADVDNDSDLDLFKCRINAENRLYINNGSGFFSDEGRGRGIQSLSGKTSAAVAWDADNDGDIDLLAVNQNSKHEMYINDGNGFFSLQDRGFRAGASVNKDMPTACVVDFDGDGDADVYINWPNQKNELYVNDGKGYFTEQADLYNIAFAINSQGASFADVDKDGDSDLFVSDKVKAYTSDSLNLAIYQNDGSGRFSAVNLAKKLTMNGYAVQLFDADNDGNLDIYCLQNNLYDRWCVKPRVWNYFRTSMGRLYLGDDSGNFTHAGAGGADIIGYDARSFVANDFNQDGQLDIYFTAAMFENVYLQNSSDLSKNWLELTVVGPRGDWGGLGSKIWLYQSGHLGDRAYLLAYDEVFPQSSYLASNNIRRHFGLGNLTACDIQIKRTDGTEQTRLNVPANQRLVLSPDVLSLYKVSGDNQSGTVSQLLPEPFVVELLNQHDQPIEKAAVHFQVVQGSAIIQGNPTILTDTHGRAQVFVMAGSEPGPLTIQAAVESALYSPQQFNAVIHSETHVYAMQSVSGDNQSGTVGKTLPSPFVVQVTDENNHPSIGRLVTFRLMHGDGNFYGETTFPVSTDNAGEAAALLSLGRIAYQIGMVNVVAEDVAQQISFHFHTLPDLPDTLTILAGNNQQGDPQTLLPENLVVQLHDQYRNAIAAFPILFSVVQGDCAVNGSSQATVATDSSGVVSVSVRLGTTAGESIVRASAGNAVAEFHLFTHSRQPDIALSTLTATSPVEADGQSASTLTATIVDPLNQPLAGIEVIFQVFGEGIILDQPNRVSDAQGRVIGFLTSSVAGTKLVVARVMPQNELLTQSATVNFIQPTMAIYIVAGEGQEGIVGRKALLPLTTRAMKNGGPLAGGLISYRIEAGDGRFEGGDSLTLQADAQGISAAEFFLGRKAGINTVRAYPLAAPEKSVIFTLHGRADEASKLMVTGGDRQSGSVSADLPAPLTVQAFDEYDNPAGSAPILFSAMDDGMV